MPRKLQLKLSGILLLALFWSVYHEHYSGNFKRTVKIDGIGYNGYLPALFIHDGNLHWSFYENKLDTLSVFEGKIQDFRKPYGNGRFINKYPLGLAIAQAPFWFSAWGYYGFSDHVSGYEPAFQAAVFINNIFWLFLGIWLFGIFLKKHHWRDNSIILFVALFLFGTNLFHFITFDNCLTHPVTVGLSMMAFYLLSKFISSSRIIFFLSFLLIFAIIFCIRPVNILMVPFFLIYFYWGNKDRPKIELKHLAWAFAGVCLALFLYLGSNKMQTGSWLVYTYQNEKFVWNEFHFLDVTFGYRCGVFLYTPILLTTVYLGFKSPNRKLVIGYLVSMLTTIYIISCWNEFCYGCRLGNRPMVDYYIFFLIPLLNLKWRPGKPEKYLLVFLWIFFLYYNQILHYQYRHYLLDWCDVKKQQFWEVFLQTDNN
ncbi:MAG: hypothetical protein KG003_05940 [Bacteroidetes bacterium]|nr:hypothetical protein [Bacteroidota bacterium]